MTDTLGLVLFVVVCAACIADSDGAEYIFHETEGRFPRLHTVLVDRFVRRPRLPAGTRRVDTLAQLATIVETR